MVDSLSSQLVAAINSGTLLVSPPLPTSGSTTVSSPGSTQVIWDQTKTNLGMPGFLPQVPNISGAFRLRENSQYVTGNSGISTTYFKIEAEAPFSAVRVWYGERNASGTPPTLNAVVAATDTGDLSTINTSYTPMVAGVSYNELSSSTVAYGFRPVTWNGAATAVATLAPSATNAAAYTVSDWIPCKSIPRSDVANGRPLALLRLANENAAGVFTTGNGAMTGYGTGVGLPWYRIFATSGNSTTDGVGTLTNLPGSLSSVPNYEKYAWLEFLYDVPVRSVMVLGDSREAAAYSTYGSSWATPALLALSTPTNPICISNFAGSGHAEYQFLALADEAMNVGFVPTDIIVPGWSQNGFQQNHAGAEAYTGLMISYLQKWRKLGIQVWMTTDYGISGYSGASEAARQECIAKTRAWAAAGLINLVDTDPIITLYVNGVSQGVNPIFDSGDHIHANPAGQALLSMALASVWK